MAHHSNWLDHVPQNIRQLLFADYMPEWLMSDAECCALITLLAQTSPECAIEIGTAQGGSLSVLARFAKKVYSLDVNPNCREQLGHCFSNVEFITGKSQKTLPLLLEQVQAEKLGLGFVLIDGDHSRRSVKQDIENLLFYRPSQPLYVVLHDSFNPECRQGMVEADWARSPYVHFVELDFVTGTLLSWPERYREMWGGLAVALLLPWERRGELRIHANQELLFQTVLQHSISHRRLDRVLVRLLSRLNGVVRQLRSRFERG